MLPTLVAISGMLAATPSAPPRAELTQVEISFVTHAGEGAEGRKRFTRDGCYQVESGGSTGGAGFARESQAGCHRPGDVAAVFARLAALPRDALLREVVKGGETRGAPAAHPPGESETQVVLIRRDGSRWLAANRATSDEVLRAINELPSENQWYATPPDKPVGAGAQLLVLSTAVPGNQSSWRFEGALASDGRWWCHIGIVAPSAHVADLPWKSASPVTNAPARLGRILEGTSAVGDGGNVGSTERVQVPGIETSVEVVWPGKARASLWPWRMAGDVVHRFIGEMRSSAPPCNVR